jgi:hypothetical protein
MDTTTLLVIQSMIFIFTIFTFVGISWWGYNHKTCWHLFVPQLAYLLNQFFFYGMILYAAYRGMTFNEYVNNAGAGETWSAILRLQGTVTLLATGLVIKFYIGKKS